jgi:hypothetical protein
MVTDPGFGWSGLVGQEDGQKSTVRLSQNGKLIKQQDRGDTVSYDDLVFRAAASKKGWYLLEVSADRTWLKDNPQLLSARSSVWFSFYAAPTARYTVPVSLPRFSVNGLDSSNTAKAGSTTTVDLKVQGAAATSMTTKVSYDGGKTWKSVPVTKTGDLWRATVRNQGAGFVALRAQAKTKQGYKTEVTVYRAYAVA